MASFQSLSHAISTTICYGSYVEDVAKSCTVRSIGLMRLPRVSRGSIR